VRRGADELVEVVNKFPDVGPIAVEGVVDFGDDSLRLAEAAPLSSSDRLDSSSSVLG